MSAASGVRASRYIPPRKPGKPTEGAHRLPRGGRVCRGPVCRVQFQVRKRRPAQLRDGLHSLRRQLHVAEAQRLRGAQGASCVIQRKNSHQQGLQPSA